MTKITVNDTYLHKNITFYTRKDLKDKDEVEQVLRLRDYLYFPIVEVKPASRLEKVLVPIFCSRTTLVDDVLFSNVKYLII